MFLFAIILFLSARIQVHIFLLFTAGDGSVSYLLVCMGKGSLGTM